MLQRTKYPCTNASEKKQRNIHDRLSKEILMIKMETLEQIKTELENEVKILRIMFEVRYITVCKICFTLNSWKILYSIHT
jgi:hypothetical protein